MFNYRFVPYLIVVGIVMFLSACYMGYREYQKHVEFETFMTNVQATLDKDSNPSLVSARTEQMESNLQGISTKSSVATHQKMSNMQHPEDFMATYQRLSNMPSPIDTLGEPVKVAVVSSAEADEEPVDMAEIPPEILAQMPDPDAPMIPLRVQTPDGNIRVILVPAGIDYNEVDIALSEEIAHSPAAPIVGLFDKVGSVRHSEIPEGETAESYLEKKSWSTYLGVSIEEVGKMMESGHIQRRNVSRSPVVEFPIEELIGDDRRSSGSIDEALPSEEHQSKAPVFDRRIFKDTQRAPDRSDVLVSPSDLSDIFKPISPQSVEDIEKQLTPQGIEAELEGLSTDRVSKAQQLIDQYGSEEGLRRLRESDPGAAERFESDTSRPGRERRNPPARDTSEDAASIQ